jgi:SAM-dependent methyltransferase
LRRLLGFRVMRPVRSLWYWVNARRAHSRDYRVIAEVPLALTVGYRDARVARRQHAVFRRLLDRLDAGEVREDFRAVADGVRLTGLRDPLVIEVGCASGWNVEVLSRLLGRPARYIGLDYSPASIRLARQTYAAARFVIGDATALPFRDGACDVLLSGGVLMHLAAYERAITESRRVARRWCIFHTVTVAHRRSTTLMRKLAYGRPVVEVVFNRKELLDLFATRGLTVRHELESIPYDLAEHLGEATSSRTYVCEVGAPEVR